MGIVYRMQTDSPIGRLNLVSSEKGLSAIFFSTEPRDSDLQFIKKHFTWDELRLGGEHNKHAAEELNEYFAGNLKKFSVMIDMKSTGFPRQVHRQLTKIPYGKTRTYGEIAALLDKPNGARAVGSANGANKIPIIIPCHRVLAANGLGGYAGGLDVKRKLLKLEGSLGELGL